MADVYTETSVKLPRSCHAGRSSKQVDSSSIRRFPSSVQIRWYSSCSSSHPHTGCSPAGGLLPRLTPKPTLATTGLIFPKGRAPNHGALSGCAGSVKLKMAPRGTLVLAHNRPPCPSMMERQIDRPIPKTPGLVVYNAPKMRSRGARASPGLESCAATTTLSDLALPVLISNFRDLSPRLRIASIALMIKLRIPSCSWTRSP
jgi:hypothetical protein